jgi:hypothetical protein
MKRRVQPLMARDTLGFEYTGDDDTSRMPGGEVDDDIVDRLTFRPLVFSFHNNTLPPV